MTTTHHIIFKEEDWISCGFQLINYAHVVLVNQWNDALRHIIFHTLTFWNVYYTYLAYGTSIIFIKLTNYSKKDLLLIRLIIFHKFLSIKIYKFAGFAETSFLKTSFDVGGQGSPALLFNLLSIIRNIILIEKYAKKINCMVVLMVQQRQQQHQHHCALFFMALHYSRYEAPHWGGPLKIEQSRRTPGRLTSIHLCIFCWLLRITNRTHIIFYEWWWNFRST